MVGNIRQRAEPWHLPSGPGPNRKSMQSAAGGQKIALCHLASLTCLPALNLLFSQLGDQIGLVLSSQRFGSQHGGLFTQLVQNVRRSGVRLTFWLGFEIISVQVAAGVSRWLRRVTRRDPALAALDELAARHGSRIVETGDVNSADAIAMVEAYAPDTIVILNFDQILRAGFIALPRIGVVNVHPSLLPSLRGPCPVFWALAEGRSIAGVTIHSIDDETIDTGPILDRVEVPVDIGRAVAETNAELFLTGAEMLPTALETLAAGRTIAQPQNPTEGSYRGFPNRQDMRAARARGVRLCSYAYVARLLMAAGGLTKSWPDRRISRATIG